VQDIAFSGSIPENYDRGLGPVLFEPYALEVASRLKGLKEGAVLEIACGSGRVTRQLRTALAKNVRLVATDLSEGMVEHAKSISKGQIEWAQVDAQSLPYADGEFDAVICQFGLMFVPEKVQALQEFRRVLKPEGRAFCYVWDRIDRMPVQALQQKLLRAEFPENPPEFLDIPFSMYDPEATAELFEEAGFTKVLIERVEKKAVIEDPHMLAVGCILGNPVANQIKERDPEAPERLIARLEAQIRELPPHSMSALLVTASG